MQKAALAPPFPFGWWLGKNIDLPWELAYRPRDPTNQGWSSELASGLSRPGSKIWPETESRCDRCPISRSNTKTLVPC